MYPRAGKRIPGVGMGMWENVSRLSAVVDAGVAEGHCRPFPLVEHQVPAVLAGTPGGTSRLYSPECQPCPACCCVAAAPKINREHGEMQQRPLDENRDIGHLGKADRTMD